MGQGGGTMKTWIFICLFFIGCNSQSPTGPSEQASNEDKEWICFIPTPNKEATWNSKN